MVHQVVADDSGERRSPYFLKLIRPERSGMTSVFVPKSVSLLQVQKLLAEDAGKSRTNNSTSDRFFSHSTGKLVVKDV